MATAARLLFPDLPPELRNEIYNYLSTTNANATASLSSLPLKLRTYEDKHTTVQICPVHYGSDGLLELQAYRFGEGREYSSWLLNNAIQLKIGVAFTGRVDTFVQDHWDKKMEAHLRKLARLHPWLTKVAKYDIQILWDPIDSTLKSKKHKKVAGQIPRDMVTTMTALVSGDLRRTKGNLSVDLHLAYSICKATELSRTPFGYAEFFNSQATEQQAFKSQKKEVWMEAPIKRLQSSEPVFGFLPNPIAKKEETNLLVVDKGYVKWAWDPNSKRIMRKHLVDGVEATVIGGGTEHSDVLLDYVVASSVRECQDGMHLS